MTTPVSSLALGRVSFGATIRTGAAPSLASCTYTSRLTQLIETLDAGWTDYRGHAWGSPYSRSLSQVAGLHSLRLAVLAPPGSVLLELTYEGDQAAFLKATRSALGPLLDLVFCNCDGYPGTREITDEVFAAWVRGAQPAAKQGDASTVVALLTYLGAPGDTAAAPSPNEFAFAMHALADLQRLSNLFIEQSDSLALQRATRSLLPGLQGKLGATLVAAEHAVRERFSEAVGWFTGAHAPAEPIVCPAGFSEPDGTRSIEINGRQLFNEVMLDAGSHYSVSGYAERMGKSFGLIYLGLDKSDPDYGLQSAESNRAIGRISEREAFSRALDATRTVVAPLDGAATFDIKDISDKVLAALCTLWFDIPDGNWVVSSGSVLPFPPGRCPGQFAPPSGYIFQPEPGWIMQRVGQADGKILHSHVAQFVAAQRASGKAPTGVLAKALFAAFPKSPEQDDLLARTLIGVMIGFLPTVQGNLVAAVKSWEGMAFEAMRRDFLADPAQDIYQRATTVIRPPLVAAMQQAPVPPAIWRTAKDDHDLNADPVVKVRRGDRLYINIDSATREDLAAKIADVTPVFGGDRSQPNHPTHACPGLWMGMGVLLGIVAGALEAGPTLAPMTATRGSAVS